METETLKLHEIKQRKENYVVAIGFFDGLHLGHQALIREVLKVAKEKSLMPAVICLLYTSPSPRDRG